MAEEAKLTMQIVELITGIYKLILELNKSKKIKDQNRENFW
jgi:hypothetical protein